MSPKNRWLRRPWIVAIIFVVVAGFAVLIFGQQGGRMANPTNSLQVPILSHGHQESPEDIQGLPDDWTHHHLVFSNPGTEEEAIQNGTHERWLKVVNDPRYIIQQLKRRAPAQGPYAEYVDRMNEAARDTADSASLDLPADQLEDAVRLVKGHRPAPRNAIHNDWSTSLGSGVAASQTGTFSGAPSSSQTVKVNGLTLTATTSSQTGTVAELHNCGSGSSPCVSAGDSVTIGNVVYEFATTQANCSGTYEVCVSEGSSSEDAAKNLQAAINNATGDCSGESGTWGSTCFTVVTTGDAPNPGASSSRSSYTNTVTNLTNTTLPLSTSNTSHWTVSTSGITQVNSCSSATSGKLIIDGNSPTQQAANLAGAIAWCNSNETGVGVTATSSGATVTVTATTAGAGGNSIALTEGLSNFSWTGTTLANGTTATVQPNMYPAEYSFSTTGASCSDFVVYPTGQAGSSGAANIIAYDNLYSGSTGSGGCGTTGVPTVDWAYNTGGTVTTSPILSYFDNGAQVAFIQVSGTTASLVLLKWAATGGSVTSPTTLTSQSASNYRLCTAPCMYSVALSGSPNDTLSAPFYDYHNDLLYVGDDSGNLHQFSGVFNGSPAENTTSPWPVHLGSNKLSSPVYDSEEGFQGGYVFVGDMGGVFYSVGTGYGGTTNGQIHGNTGSLGDAIADAPLVDSSEGIELVFVTTDGSSKPYSGGNGVFEFVSSFTVYGTPGVVTVGTGGTGYYLYAGDFDNVYYQSGNPAYGHLYVAGNTGVQGGATLYQVEIAYSSLTGTVNSVATGLNSTEYPWPSPLTDFCNNGTSACAITSQRTVTGKVSTTSPEITLSSGTFTSADVGAVVSGTDIQFGATISSVLSSTTANLSAAPTAGVTSESLAILGGQTTSGTDYVFFSVNSPASGLCQTSGGTAESGSGWGCIFSYNVSKPASVSRSGTGLAVTVPSSNGCWATGGLVIDNSATTAGASQIYLVNLNGAAAGGPTGTTQTSSNCTGGAAPTINAVQAAQSSP
jgi:hypothetical protein